MEGLVIAGRHHFFHSLHILALGLHQSIEILACLGEDRPRAAAKMRRKALPEIQEARPHLFERS